MQIALTDRAPLEKVRRLADGRIAAVAKFARSGCYHYAGSELGRPELSTVTVYRPETEVFDQATMASFAHKAITLGHPSGAVTADNWKQHSVGWTEGKVARDGEFVEIPLMLADASAVAAYDSGEARELSAGYTCELVWGDGIAPDGMRYQATQTRIRGNHIAQVPTGRAGELCRIGDSSGDAAVRAIVDQARAEHAQRFSFLGNTAPAFDEAAATLVARTKVQDAAYRPVLATMAEHRDTGAVPLPATPASTSQGAGDRSSGAFADNAAVVNAIRLARYQ